MKKDQRYYVRLAKAYSNLDYKYIAYCLDIECSSFYNWLNYQYELSQKKQKQLETLLKTTIPNYEKEGENNE